MTDWQARMTEDMKLRDFRPRTQEAYLLAGKLLQRHFGRPPDSLTEADLRDYFLHLREVRKLAPSTLSVTANGLRFLYVHTLKMDWSLFELLRVHKPRTLPAELRRIVRRHQKVLCDVLFRAAFESLSELAAGPRYLGAQIGALAVLHTWTHAPSSGTRMSI